MVLGMYVVWTQYKQLALRRNPTPWFTVWKTMTKKHDPHMPSHIIRRMLFRDHGDQVTHQRKG